MILTIFCLVLAVASVNGDAALRVYQGQDDHLNRFPFVVMVNSVRNPDKRGCTGSLIANNWVLTAEHCTAPIPMIIRYGDFTLPANKTHLFSHVLRQCHYPNSGGKMLEHDIALFLIEKVNKRPARLSAVDYKTLIGLPVEYAGFGHFSKILMIPDDEWKSVQSKPLQVGEAVVIPCSTLPPDLLQRGYGLCLASKCSAREQQARPGDSGGPLVHDGRIVGVCWRGEYTFTEYTAVSPYLQWIRKTMNTYT